MAAYTEASRQLFKRPADQRYHSMDSVIDFLKTREKSTIEAPVRSMRVQAIDNDALSLSIDSYKIEGRKMTRMTDWSFGTLCRNVGAPKGYINELPARLAEECLNHGLVEKEKKGNGTIVNIGDVDGYPTARAFYSDRYERVPDLYVAETVKEQALQYGYIPAGLLAGKRGGAPHNPDYSGLYASDRDVFFFFANESVPFEVEGEELYHMFMVWNSEVTARTLGFSSCLYRFICGNHMVWGTRDLVEMSARHVGSPQKVIDNFKLVLQGYEGYRNVQVEISKARISQAMRKTFADTREKIAERLESYMTRKEANAVLPFIESPVAYPKAPNSVWGVANGMTLYSQTVPYQDRRLEIDQAAGRMMEKEVGF